MATVLLSQHSSNPLEVGSSDPRNKAYHQEYITAQNDNGHFTLTSEDGNYGLDRPEMVHYHNHLARLYSKQGVVPSTIKRKPHPDELPIVDLDESMEYTDDIQFDPPHDMGTLDDDDDNIPDEDVDADGETDEEKTLFLKPPDEQQEIRLEIANLNNAVPSLSEDYAIIDRLGTGTFSSVYKAIDLAYNSKWDNTAWHGYSPPMSSHSHSVSYHHGSKTFVAIKRIYVTSSPERIRNEISIMEDCRGCRHTSQLITAFRHHDQVVAIMPYSRNEDFRVRKLAYFGSLKRP